MRNLLLNWFILLPLLAILVLLPQLWATWLDILAARDGGAMDFWGIEVATGFALIAVIVAIAYVQVDLPSGGDRRGRQGHFLAFGLLPLVVAAALLTRAWVSIVSPTSAYAPLRTEWYYVFAFIGAGIALHSLAAGAGYVVSLLWPHSRADRRAAAERRPHDVWDVLAEIVMVVVSGGLGGFGLWLAVRNVPPKTAVLVSVGPPLLLTIFFLATVVAVGLVSRSTEDEDREWWARSGGWVLIAALAWLVLTAAALAGPLVGPWLRRLIAVAGGASGVLTYLAGRSAKTVAGRRPDADASVSGWSDRAVKIGAPLFLLCLIVAAGWLTEWLPRWWWTPEGYNTIPYVAPGDRAVFDLILLAILGAVCFIASLTVDVNRFSLHAMYRSRLIRAYLGASRPREGEGCRDPHPFTGFDPNDNLPMQTLQHEDNRPGHAQLPFHIVNVALNLVKGTRLAWQHRKAASFTFTPLHSGSLILEDEVPPERLPEGDEEERRTPPSIKGAYQPSAMYCDGKGVSLGTAVAISGAAVSPNMGYHSSPIVTLLLALFNARLGWWLANPGRAGVNRWKLRGPRFALHPLLAEAFGLTNDHSKYVYLSDGGHFENLGLYEMVLRRCHTIVLVDGGCDLERQLEDLGNAVRKIRIDLGIEIDLAPGVGRTADAPPGHFVVGTIHYAKVDKSHDARDGTIYYVKPIVSGDESVDVLNYAAAHKDFPHESTADQWFDEDQFETYRTLGLHSADLLAPQLAAELAKTACAA